MHFCILQSQINDLNQKVNAKCNRPSFNIQEIEAENGGFQIIGEPRWEDLEVVLPFSALNIIQVNEFPVEISLHIYGDSDYTDYLETWKAHYNGYSIPINYSKNINAINFEKDINEQEVTVFLNIKNIWRTHETCGVDRV